MLRGGARRTVMRQTLGRPERNRGAKFSRVAGGYRLGPAKNLLSERRLNQIHKLVLNRLGPVGLRQIPTNEHADQQGQNCTHGCGGLKKPVSINNTKKLQMGQGAG